MIGGIYQLRDSILGCYGTVYALGELGSPVFVAAQFEKQLTELEMARILRGLQTRLVLAANTPEAFYAHERFGRKP